MQIFLRFKKILSRYGRKYENYDESSVVLVIHEADDIAHLKMASFYIPMYVKYVICKIIE